MRLRVTTESDTFVYATSPISFGGMNKEDLIIGMFPMMVGSTAGASPFVTLFVGVFCLWLYKKLTANKPEGFLVLAIASGFGSLLYLPVVQKNPALRRICLVLVKAINRVWISNGLLPTPSYCNLYER